MSGASDQYVHISDDVRVVDKSPYQEGIVTVALLWNGDDLPGGRDFRMIRLTEPAARKLGEALLAPEGLNQG